MGMEEPREVPADEGHEDHRRVRPVVYSLVMIFVCLAAMIVFIYLFTESAIKRSEADNNRKWCDLVSTLDDAYTANPPQTPTGRQVASQIHFLRVDFGCL